MEEVIIRAIKNNNYMLLRQVLLNINVFAQIDQLFYNHSEINQFYSSFQLITIDDHNILDIQSNNLYLFVTKGAIFCSKMMKQSKTTKKVIRKRIRKKSNLKNNNQFLSQKIQVLEGTIDNLQSWLIQNQKVNKFFIASHGPAVILTLPSSALPQDICNKIKSYYFEKLKIISKYEIFKLISKNVIQNHIHNFKFIKVIFNHHLYNSTKRTNDVFFLQKGQIQISSNHRKIIVKGPALLGNGNQNTSESAKCLTHYSIAFSLNKTHLEEIIKEDSQVQQKQFFNQSIIRSQYIQRSLTPQQIQNYSNRCSLQYTQSKKNRNSRGSQKQILLRRYFSNYLNEQYDQFYQKKTHLLKQLGIQNQQPVLYDMKTLTPKQPNYDEMKKRLKGVRLKKIIELKEKAQNRKSLKSIQNSKNSKVYDDNKKLKQISFNDKKCLILKEKQKKRLQYDRFPLRNFVL